MFDIKYSKQAIKFLKSLDKNLVLRILKKIETLREKPIQHDSKTVEGYSEKLFRVRIGDYRILYEVDYENNLVGGGEDRKKSESLLIFNLSGSVINFDETSMM